MITMAQIEQLEKMAQKVIRISIRMAHCEVRNAPAVYTFQSKVAEAYLNKARELRMQLLNTKGNE
jgi:hypothetical protein